MKIRNKTNILLFIGPVCLPQRKIYSWVAVKSTSTSIKVSIFPEVSLDSKTASSLACYINHENKMTCLSDMDTRKKGEEITIAEY